VFCLLSWKKLRNVTYSQSFIKLITYISHCFLFDFEDAVFISVSSTFPVHETYLGILSHLLFSFSCGSSGSIVSDYGLDDRAIEVRSPTGTEDFSSSPCFQTGSGAHPASYPMGTGGSFPGGKARPGRDADHSPPSSAEFKNE
jgi:hypothetical protein